MPYKKKVGERGSMDVFYVTLFSNATNKNGQNSTTKFVNSLAKSIYLDPSHNWHFGLQSILCSNRFNAKVNSPVFGKKKEAVYSYSAPLSQIFVKCGIQSHPYDPSQIISAHSRNPYRRYNNRVHFYEPENILYFKINSDTIQDIEVTLQDSNLKQLSLARGLATSCVLKFKRMHDEIVPLFINSHGVGAQAGNKSSNFVCNIPPFFDNYSAFKWEVCLQSVTYVPDFILFPSHIVQNSFFALYEWTKLDDNELDYNNDDNGDGGDGGDGGEEGELMETDSFETEAFDSESKLFLTNEMVSEWSSELDVRKWIFLYLMKELKTPKGKPLSEFVKFERLIREDADEKLNRPIIMNMIRGCHLYMPLWFAHVCGFRNVETPENSPTPFPPEYASTAVFRCLPDRPIRKRANARMDVFQLIPHSISIKTSIVDPSLVGESYSNYIKTFPVIKTYGEAVQSETVESKNLEWHTVRTREVRSIDFTLLDHAGNEIEFANNNQNIHFSMLVKKYV